MGGTICLPVTDLCPPQAGHGIFQVLPQVSDVLYCPHASCLRVLSWKHTFYGILLEDVWTCTHILNHTYTHSTHTHTQPREENIWHTLFSYDVTVRLGWEVKWLPITMTASMGACPQTPSWQFETWTINQPVSQTGCTACKSFIILRSIDNFPSGRRRNVVLWHHALCQWVGDAVVKANVKADSVRAPFLLCQGRRENTAAPVHRLPPQPSSTWGTQLWKTHICFMYFPAPPLQMKRFFHWDIRPVLKKFCWAEKGGQRFRPVSRGAQQRIYLSAPIKPLC